MLSVRASPSPSDSVYDYRLGGGTIGRIDEEPNYESRRKRYLDGSHKGLGLGFDTATCAAPAYNNNRSNGGLDSQRPRAFIHAYGKDSRRVSQFQSAANHNLGSRYPPQQACPILPSRDLSESSQNLLDAKGRSRNFQIPSQSAMPVPSVGLRPHVKVNKYRPPPLNPPVQPNFAVQQNQKNQGPFIALHLQREALPPLPPGPSPPYLQGTLSFQNPCPVAPSNQPGISAYSGLVSSLLAQGLILLTNQTPPKDSLGVEFKADLLKMRHESVITALYDDIPRQCATCGRRFKCQEEHRRHMDWHVTKNRMSKNHKHNPSRKWFVSTSMCLLAAKALGTDAAPNFMSADTIVEKKSSDEEMTVPADEDQTSCALCRERFDDFYSHDREEWMYKDAVYFNAPEGSTEGMDRSELGPIVHAKCRPEGSQRKRLRRS